MLEISYNGKKYQLNHHPGVSLEAKAGYGNNAISLPDESIGVQEAITLVAPTVAPHAVAVKFNDEILSLKDRIKQNGNLTIITADDALAKKIMLDTAAFYWDMACFEMYKSAKRYQKIVTSSKVQLVYFVEEPQNFPLIQRISEQAEKLLNSNLPIEPIILSVLDTEQYYQKQGEWYLLKNLLAEDSDYPYKFFRVGDYLIRREGIVLCAPKFIQKILLQDMTYAQEQEKMILKINLTVEINPSV